MLKFQVDQQNGFQLLEVTFDGDALVPEDIADIQLPVEIDCTGGVIISGRLPIWAHSAIAHQLHPTAWVAHLDPRLGGGVIVQSHKKGFTVGQVIPV